MGIAVFSGMLGVTFFGLIFTPLFYVLIRGIAARRARDNELRPIDIPPLRTWPRALAAGDGRSHA
jgi:hypothetical protein